MLKTTFLLGAATLASVAAAGAQQRQPAAVASIVASAWETLPTGPYPGKRDDVSFADPRHGWYGTGKGDRLEEWRGRDGYPRQGAAPGTEPSPFGEGRLALPSWRLGRYADAAGTSRGRRLWTWERA